MKFETVIRKSKLGYSYIRANREGEATLIDFDTDKLGKFHGKLDKWYDCIIDADKNGKIKNIRREE